MRRALLSVAVGLAGAAGVTASGWALQAASLSPPKPADRIAADASAWFHDHRLVVGVLHVDHRRISGACLRGWFAPKHRVKTRGSLLSLRPGGVAFVPADRKKSAAVAVKGRTRLEAAAICSDELAPALAAAVQNGRKLTAARSYAAGQPAIALRIRRVSHERLTLDVSPPTDRPLVAIVAIGGHTARARLYLTRTKPGLLRRFHLPYEGRAGRLR